MCGIVGRWSRKPSAAASGFTRALDLLEHRGPDNRGFAELPVRNGYLSLGHTRLSVIDLSSSGDQPMWDSSDRYCITFNGEIVNYVELRRELAKTGYQFEGNSDTETLLAAWSTWGRECLPRLEGMWAFGVFDRLNHTLTLTRDPFGIKPLFWSMAGSEVVFASEIRSLLAAAERRWSVDRGTALRYLAYGRYDDSSDSFVEGVSHVLPGTLLTFDLSQPTQPRTERWWNPSTAMAEISFGEAKSTMTQLMFETVERNLRSDVPLAVALSGGLDSSILACIARELLPPERPLYTFSYLADDPRLDESDWIRAVVADTGAVQHDIRIAVRDIPGLVDAAILAQGEPFQSTSVVAQYALYQSVRDAGIVVALDGQGADELFAGYDGYPGPRLASLLRGGSLLSAVRYVQSWRKWPGRSLRTAAQDLASAAAPRSTDRLESLIPIGRRWPWITETPGPRRGAGAAGAGRRALAVGTVASFTSGTLRRLLRHGDRNSMAASVESRVPYLTQGIAEFALSLPEEFLVSWQGETKHILRGAMRGVVPSSVLSRRDKIGFETTQSRWLAGVSERADEWLDPLSGFPGVRLDRVRECVAAGCRGTGDQAQAWRLLNFGRWLHHFDELHF